MFSEPALLPLPITIDDPLLMEVRLQELFSDPPRLNGICVVEAVPERSSCPPYPWSSK